MQARVKISGEIPLEALGVVKSEVRDFDVELLQLVGPEILVSVLRLAVSDFVTATGARQEQVTVTMPVSLWDDWRWHQQEHEDVHRFFAPAIDGEHFFAAKLGVKVRIDVPARPAMFASHD